MALRVLVIDDDTRLYELLADYLCQHDVTLAHARDGREGLSRLETDAFDAVLLDVMMPGIDGLEVLRRIRQKAKLPVIMLTARGDESDRVVGLELGADDYVAKPFSPRELLARLRAVLRRATPDATGERLSAGGILVDVGARSAEVDGKLVDLTGLEFDILVALVRRAGRVVPRNALLSEAGRGDVVVSERTVDVHISRLRKKIGDDPKTPFRIKTVRGIGYVLPRELG
jgi:two-component system, OmpR family, response regulator